MWKKALLVLSLFTFVFTAAAPLIDDADAKRRSFSSGKKSFSKTPAQSQNSTNNGTTSKPGAAATSTNKGIFGGGSFMKGMMIGGLAGLLFGSMFGGMGFMGELLGLMINVMAIIALFAIVRAVFTAIRRKRESQRPQHPNQNDRRW